eukprot:CAMPEP_0204289972 /NCGR_PEP_ID=MMETSP0468-20130131/59616_1 /ASSEMBLY_ACC=CAM_ASM_000383 /TAXON_ID=2969 /ORGANISM="Oxyrrhis marina" /LENGTH=45 /DNA_ID= /DNA_START= /DNA_END= /DNA_ORIENTATION=
MVHFVNVLVQPFGLMQQPVYPIEMGVGPQQNNCDEQDVVRASRKQ